MVRTYLLDIGYLEEKDNFWREYEKCSIERQRKADVFRNENARRLCIGAGVLLYYGLQEWGLDSRREDMAYGEYGKPYMKYHPEIHFNLSHSGNMVVGCFHREPIGVDIEIFSLDYPQVAEHFFGDLQQIQLKTLPSNKEKAIYFYEEWTRIESYIKYRGYNFAKYKEDKDYFDEKVEYKKYSLKDAYIGRICAAKGTQFAEIRQLEKELL